MDSEELIDLIRSTPREQFIARMRNLFLLVTARSLDEEDSGFQTLVEEPEEGRRSSAARRLMILEIVKAPGNPYPDRISVGRARNCDLVLRDSSVSKLHAHFRVREGALEVIDLDSQNGTWLNEQALAPQAAAKVRSGDTVVFGSVGARLVDAGLLHDLFK